MDGFMRLPTKGWKKRAQEARAGGQADVNDQPRTPETERPVTPLRAALNQYRGGFMAIAGFSALVNILMLVSPMYMLQMYDRVLTSFSPQTLIMLTLIAFFLLGCFGLLEWVRQRLMQRIGLALGLNMAEDVLTSAFRSSLANQAQGATQPVRDLDSIRQFMGSPTIFAFFDIPWTPIFTAVIFMFHPLMGAVAVFGALVILTLGLLAEFRSRMPMRAAAMEGLQSHQLLESSMRNSDSLKAMGMFEGLMGRWQGQHRRSASFQSSAAGRLSMFQPVPAMAPDTRCRNAEMSASSGPHTWCPISYSRHSIWQPAASSLVLESSPRRNGSTSS